MKIGLFSDIHSNLEAFESVLSALKQAKVDRYIFLGDLVGYGASPRECIEMLKRLIDEKGCLCIAGNHDYAVCGLTVYEQYALHAKASIEWTKKQLNSQQLKFLAELPLVDDSRHAFGGDELLEQFTIVHANLLSPKDWRYIWDIDDAFESFQILQHRLCFVGHSHKPLVFTCGSIVDWFIRDQIPLKKDLKYIINVGSVGQPRDGNPKACYAIYDTQADLVTIERIDYDIATAQAKIISAGLPKLLADRLATGK